MVFKSGRVIKVCGKMMTFVYLYDLNVQFECFQNRRRLFTYLSESPKKSIAKPQILGRFPPLQFSKFLGVQVHKSQLQNTAQLKIVIKVNFLK
jgi:hypothetical protein